MLKKIKSFAFVLIYVAIFFLILKYFYSFWLNVVLKISPNIDKYGVHMINIVFDLITILIFTLTALILKRQSIWKACNISRMSFKNAMLSLLIGVSMGSFVICVIKTPVLLEKYPLLNRALESIILDSNIISFSIFLILNSTVKEVVFRGMVFRELRNAVPTAPAIILQGIAYAGLAFNFNLALSIDGFIGSVLFALVFIWSGSLFGSIIVQISSTGFMYFLARMEDTIVNPSTHIYLITLSLVALFIGIVLMYKSNRKSIDVKTGNAASI